MTGTTKRNGCKRNMKLVVNSLKCVSAVLVVLCMANHVLAAIDVKLRERAASHGSVVRLGDVAEIGTMDKQQARQLGSLPLMPAPAPGTERFLRTREIQDMLSAQGVDLGDLRFAGAAQVVVAAADGSRASSDVVQISSETRIGEHAKPMNQHAAILAGVAPEQALSQLSADETRANEIRQQLKSIVGNYLNVKTGKAQTWKVGCDPTDREIAKLDTALSTPVCVGGSEPWTGRQRFLISFSTADGQVQLPIFAEISPPPMPAVVAIRPIGRGEVVKAADIELRTVDANSKSVGQRAAADSVENLIGMEARQAIQTGDIIFTDQVQPPIVVKRGDVITVTSQSGGIRVRTSGRAMQDASRGELVQIEALGSHQKYDARVTGPREAAVYAMSRPAGAEPVKRIDTARRQSIHHEGMTSTTVR
jgi:flagella basal body P-ring formation protein FlgA